ncbi:ATP-binding cassette domain-containing protein [Colwellia demingiae]|uniref:ATP-binding cassette domain-containing protein n=1 Tax=Colwellia demingiae TaxID=89401 RepID=A0A5C6QSX9_9GAMM|nr:ABC transporter ATP-binding protein [Colwellia demingiae]TWX72054.1 ATP-binding cassette domain-containing protein [Colwellia demingiae]
MSIVTNELTFYYGKKAAIDGLSLNINSGFNVLLGPNGAGKSTLFSMLTGLYQSASGDIKINGYDLNHERAKIMQSMGVVFQQSTLDLDLSVKQNLTYYAALHGISSSQALENISEILSQLQLTQRLNDKVRSLNGGHRRRVEIARALIHQPKVLLLDEATVGLDIDSRKMITEYVGSLSQQLGICVLWATHLIDEIAADDQLIIIDDGKIQAQGISGELCKKHNVADVYQLYRSLTASAEIS